MSSRRQFLRSSFIAALILPFNKLLAFSKKGEVLPSWEELIDYARWCPSVHNLQPHKIKVISETEADLYYDPARLLPIGDPQSIFATVAMGIFQEHLSIAASEYGKKVVITQVYAPITQGGAEPRLFARLKLTSTTEKEKINRELISKRRTSRLHYDGNPLKEETLKRIKDEAEKFDHEFFSSSDKELVNYIIKLNQETLFEDLSSKANSTELDHLFRYTEAEARSKRDGLWAKCMGFPGSLMKSIFHHPDRWLKGLRRKLLSKTYRAAFKGTSTLCWFGGRFSNTNDWLHAGRMLARNWLIITEEGAYIHPFGSLITNVGAYEKINKRFNQPAGDKKLWLIFRAGYSHEPTRSFRLSTKEILIS